MLGSYLFYISVATVLTCLAYATPGEHVDNDNAVYTVNDYDGVGSGTDSYTFYSGDGSVAAGWPAKSQWFNNNKNTMFSSCGWWGEADNSGPEVGEIWNAIEAQAAATYVDHRLILAVIMQESGGCVRAPSTYGSVRNPGLMQSHDGTGTCNDNNNVQNPCPNSEIDQMIADGTGGTSSGDGLANCINLTGYSDAQAIYGAARIYNAGSIPSSNDLGAPGATPCYASDIANRLTGWVDAGNTCPL
ncbi:hypothetical protein N7454_001133 [Penicillium verhagenii]|nr:hypothetical protein N7454_001133 [Penicillium verhagenii]